MLCRSASSNVVQLRNDVSGTADKIPNVVEALRGRGRCPLRMGLEGCYEVIETVEDFLTNLWRWERGGAGHVGCRWWMN